MNKKAKDTRRDKKKKAKDTRKIKNNQKIQEK